LIFGGYGKKAKHRGDVFYPCASCVTTVATYGLVETYGYGQLYGVRIAKVGTHRFMVCSRCQSGRELTRDQWEAARIISRQIDSLRVITEQDAAACAIEVARRLFPAEVADVQTLFIEEPRQLDPAPAAESTSTPVVVGTETRGTADGEWKTCPDCAEEVRAAARKCRFCGYRFAPPVGETGLP
jgi:hypothetical protein